MSSVAFILLLLLRSRTEGVIQRSRKTPEDSVVGERSKLRGSGRDSVGGRQSHSGRRSDQKRYMRMGNNGKYGGVTTDEETEGQADDFEEDYEESNKKRRSRRNSRRSYAEEDDDVDDDDGRLEVHQSREELDQEDKPAMQVIGKNFLGIRDLLNPLLF